MRALSCREKQAKLRLIQVDKEITKGDLAIHRISRPATELRLEPLQPGASIKFVLIWSSEEPLVETTGNRLYLTALTQDSASRTLLNSECGRHCHPQKDGFCMGPVSDQSWGHK